MSKFILLLFAVVITGCSGGGGGGSSSSHKKPGVVVSELNSVWDFEVDGNNYTTLTLADGVMTTNTTPDWINGSVSTSGDMCVIIENRNMVTYTFNGWISNDRNMMYGTVYTSTGGVAKWSATALGLPRLLNPDLFGIWESETWQTSGDINVETISFNWNGTVTGSNDPEFVAGSGHAYFKGGLYIVYTKLLSSGVTITLKGVSNEAKDFIDGTYTGSDGSHGYWNMSLVPSDPG